MKIHEYQAAQLFRKFDIPTLDGEVAVDVSQAKTIAQKIGYPVVLKSQVLAGGRGKAGGIKVVREAKEFTPTFEQLKKLTIKAFWISIEQ